MAPLSEELSPIVARYGRALHELHRARAVVPCDWQLDMAAGAGLILPHVDNRAREVAAESGFLDESGRIPFPDSDVYRILKIEGTEYRILDLLVPKRLDTIAWTQRQWFDWNGLPICSVSRDGLIEMKLAAGRDIDRIDIKQLGFADDE